MPAIAPKPEFLAPLVHTIRGERVLLDADLAALYGVPTKVLNQAVKRNLERFPTDFMFQLTAREWADLRSQLVTSKAVLKRWRSGTTSSLPLYSTP